ncbi:hypothetical protein RN001_013180 [Aquatica leii]|uniref:O-acyltransferase n=1 Tax=Aquatica leii TaxID=1421715 RepID=A0AAN7NW43_9COLE|nr:hypothetical protein RN001_013180 [Aquatica leii]
MGVKDKSNDNRYDKYEKLPKKIFMQRPSRLTELAEQNPHFQHFYYIFFCLVLLTIVSTAITNYKKENKFYLGSEIITPAFRKLDVAFLMWICLFVSSVLVYFGFMTWIIIRKLLQNFAILNKLWNAVCLLSYVFYLFFLFYYPCKYVIAYDLGVASSLAVLMEATRLSMKVHAFVRTNCSKYLQKSNKQLDPKFYHYLYFSFAPTLIYKDSYPRSTTPIRWNIIFRYFFEIILGILFFSIVYDNSFRQSLNNCGLKPHSWLDIITILVQNMYPTIILILTLFYFVNLTKTAIVPFTKRRKTDNIKLRCTEFDKHEKLPEIIFMQRPSPLTDLTEQNPHFQHFYYIVFCLMLLTIVSTAITNYKKENKFYLGSEIITPAFRNLDVAFLMWICLFVSSVFAYFGFMGWTIIRKLFQSTLSMKVHSFVRTNYSKYLKKSNKQPDPKFYHYLYFSFAPTLIYKDSYPRSNTPIRWNIIFKHFIEIIVGFLFSSIVFDNSFRRRLSNCGLKPHSWLDIITIQIQNMYPTIMIILTIFYFGFHCYLNATAELLRFADRLFYKDWWVSKPLLKNIRDWNFFVHSWLYIYVYKECYDNVFAKNRFLPKLAVFIFSAFFHDVVLGFSLRIYMPVHCGKSRFTFRELEAMSQDEFLKLLEEISSGDESDIGDLSDNENDKEEEDNILDFNINDLDIVFLDDNFERNGVSDQINSNDNEEWESKNKLSLSAIRENELKRHTIFTKFTKYCIKRKK